MKDILIIGAGASGIASAITAARTDPSAKIILLDGLDRVGKKILATGNGRCNLANAEPSPQHYHSASPHRMEHFLESMPCERTLNFFSELGLLTALEDDGRYYPHSRQASSVLDTLLLALRRYKIDVHCGCKVIQIKRKNERFVVECENTEVFTAHRVILAAGGMSAPKQGSDGSGLSIARSLGHKSVPTYPCLTAFRCDNPAVKGLKGVRAEGKLTLFVDGTQVGQELGEIQFTDYGLSGIPAFNLSPMLRPGWKKAELVVSLLPQLNESKLKSMVKRAIALAPGETLEGFLPGFVHRKLLYAVMKSVGISPLSRSANSLSVKEIERLVHTLTHWSFPVSGVLGWDQAQVTGGGVSLNEVDDHFQSKLCGGLYLTGELLDVVGDCGGYNLHWAWCSGMEAGAWAAAI